MNTENKRHRFLIYLFALLSLGGFLDSLYLTVNHYSGAAVECVVVSECDQVLASGYALILGIPAALLGAIYYFTIFGLAVFCLTSGSFTFFRWAMRFSVIGIIVSLWFVFVQAFLLKSFCFYCLVSATIATILFATAVYFWRLSRADHRD